MPFAVERPARQAPAVRDLLCRFFTYLWDAHTARAARRRSFAALRDLDLRLLADVGLKPADRRRLLARAIPDPASAAEVIRLTGDWS